MKSIMEEASSLSKAIDRAWNRAGKPSKFTVRVLEEPEHNMFGLTVKSAKIALFFDEKRTVETSSYSSDKTPRPRQEQPHRRHAPSTDRPARAPRFEQRTPDRPEKTPIRRPRPEWNDELAQQAKDWVSQTLAKIGLPHIEYRTMPDNNLLRFTFKSSLTGTEGKDRMLFSSFACLIMTTLRHRYKRQLKNLKVVLTTE